MFHLSQYPFHSDSLMNPWYLQHWYPESPWFSSFSSIISSDYGISWSNAPFWPIWLFLSLSIIVKLMHDVSEPASQTLQAWSMHSVVILFCLSSLASWLEEVCVCLAKARLELIQISSLQSDVIIHFGWCAVILLNFSCPTELWLYLE